MHSVVIVGSGFSGLGMAIALKKAGRHDFVILEKDDDLGGTWRDNTYPGCACDIPSHLYSFSFAPHPGWSRMYPRQQEIWDYLRRCADRYGLRPHIRYGVEVNSAEWDEGAPDTQRLYRTFIYWRQEAGALGFVHPRLMGLAATIARWHLKRQVPDPRMRAALTPDYTIGCKRILISDDYYPALARSNVDLITT